MNRAAALAIVGVILALSWAEAEETKNRLPPQAKMINGVVVPLPREIFGALDQFANSNWRVVQHPELGAMKPHGDQTQIALQLGTVIAEAFIAIEGQDATEVKDLGRAARTLARGLGVREAMLRRSRSIVDHASENDWTGTREEWDHVFSDLRDGMIRIKSDQLSQLVSLGGWLRGTQALSALLLQSYSPDRTELLRQPALLQHFSQQLDDLSKSQPNNPLIEKLRVGVEQVQSLVGNRGREITREDVTQISSICTELVRLISRQKLATD